MATDIYPFTFHDHSNTPADNITFTASVPSGNNVTIKFRFEFKPHPDVDPAYDTDPVTVSGSDSATYTIPITTQGDNTFSSFIMYVATFDHITHLYLANSYTDRTSSTGTWLLEMSQFKLPTYVSIDLQFWVVLMIMRTTTMLPLPEMTVRVDMMDVRIPWLRIMMLRRQMTMGLVHMYVAFECEAREFQRCRSFVSTHTRYQTCPSINFLGSLHLSSLIYSQ